MTTKKNYSEYVSDEKLIDSYGDYQEKYRNSPRESDKVSMSLVESEMLKKKNFSLLDVACSTGNFLYHMRAKIPFAHYTGVDLATGFVERCKNDKELSGINFEVADLLDLSRFRNFDVVTANALTSLIDWPNYKLGVKSIFEALCPGGIYVGFEWISPFSVQDLTIIETSEWNPDGLTFYFRPMKKVKDEMEQIGFCEVEFMPFELPIDLPHPGYDADVVTYTVKNDSGRRMAFRGALYQPWCHFVARKPR